MNYNLLMEIKKDKNLKLVLSEIGKNYVLEKQLGGGGYATIYLIHHKILNAKSALKILDIEYIEKSLQRGDYTEDFGQELSLIKRRFINEGKSFTNIRHPNIAAIKDFGIASAKKKVREIPNICPLSNSIV